MYGQLSMKELKYWFWKLNDAMLKVAGVAILPLQKKAQY